MKQYVIVSDGIFSTRFPKISRLEPKRPNTSFVPTNKLKERFYGLVLANQLRERFHGFLEFPINSQQGNRE